ncbi:MAG TPA: ribulose-phosphate 3-epimerase [Chloroflexota bacterium]|nr:ribulose-phosphate 3-epimerase [Chloroflexota bacterium]
MPDYQIVPSTLSFDQSRLWDELGDAERAGADVLQWDVMDGSFVPNLTVGWDIIAACRQATKVPFEAHLMIDEPGRYVEQFAKAGNERLIVHAEACTHLHRVLQQINGEGLHAGVAINPGTPVEAVENVLDLVDTLLVMTVNPGFGGQKFIATMLPKIRQARNVIAMRQLEVQIEVDGGIAPETIRKAYDCGATKLVTGSFVASHPQGKRAAIAELRTKLAPPQDASLRSA